MAMTCGGKIRILQRLIPAGAALIVASAVHAGPQVTIYLTLPLEGFGHTRVLGLRLDRPAVASLNRRALLDLQWGADSALRLELDRRLTWDFDRQQWRPSSQPATFTLRLPALKLRSIEP
jgi:hypothetical protein